MSSLTSNFFGILKFATNKMLISRKYEYAKNVSLTFLLKSAVLLYHPISSLLVHVNLVGM